MGKFESAFAEYARVMGSTCYSQAEMFWGWVFTAAVGVWIVYLIRRVRKLKRQKGAMKVRLRELEAELTPVARRI